MAGFLRDKLGVYISIPFCRSKCTYCNFASGVYPVSEHGQYVDRLIEDIRSAGAWAAEMGVDLPRTVDSVYLGGGTPSLLEPELIEDLFAALRAEFELERDAEITVECAPGQLADAVLDALACESVNRVSLGVQSFIDREAHVSGRLHNRAIVLDDLRRLRAAGITNLNVDLIAGLAGQTYASWEESLAALIEANVAHASVYMLEVDQESRLGREMLAGGARYHAGLVPTDEAIARMYETAIERLSGAGLEQYEISNFARPGYSSRHNVRYWQGRPYLGLGLDASSALYATASPTDGQRAPEFLLRSTTTDDLRVYLAGPRQMETLWLSPTSRHEEAWFLGLRLNSGVNVLALRQEFGERPVAWALAVVERLSESGLVHFDGARVWLTAQGRLLSNEVFEQFLGLAGEAESAHESIMK
jgi:oxygen-independent coproporphyrinogen III oxidase